MIDIADRPITDAVLVCSTHKRDFSLLDEAIQWTNKIHQNLNGKTGKNNDRRVGIFYAKEDMIRFFDSDRSQQLRKLHIIGHGRSSQSLGTSIQLGDQTPIQWKDFFNAHLAGKPALRQISLNSCHSGTPDRNLAPSMAEYIANNLAPAMHGHVRVRGYDGFAVMDVFGNNYATAIEPTSNRDLPRWAAAHRQPRPNFTAGDIDGNAALRLTAHAQACLHPYKDDWQRPQSAP